MMSVPGPAMVSNLMRCDAPLPVARSFPSEEQVHMRFLTAILGSLMLVACGGGGEAGGGASLSGSGGSLELSTKFVEGSGKSNAVGWARGMSRTLSAGGPRILDAAPPSRMQALYFENLEVVAHMSNPGGSVQMNNVSGGFTSASWSTWVILQSGHPEGSANLLKVGEQLDISKLNGPYRSVPSLAFIQEAKAFSIDILEVWVYRAGVLYNNAFYGEDAEFQVPIGSGNAGFGDRLYKYPELAGVKRVSTPTNYPGLPPQSFTGGVRTNSVSFLFVRDDWFSEPVTVLMDTASVEYPHDSPLISSSSKSLTPKQQQIITEFVRTGTSRRYYHNLVIVPFSQFHGPAMINFPDVSSFPIKTIGVRNRLVQVPDFTVWADNTQITVNFDFSDAILYPLDWTQNQTNLTFKGDANDVPFGLSVSITQKQ